MRDWLEPLGPSAGPLLPAARRFLEGHPGAPSAPCPPGAAGLRRLADAIDAWAEREAVSSQDDEAFVEGAGALLGLLLLDHLGGAHLTDGTDHRVRVGEDGFFDPFGAVERALEGDDAAETLAVEVARAEAEARGEAGVGRAMRLLRPRLGERTVARAFGPRVVLDDGVELDLSRMLRATEGEREAAAAQAIDKLVAMLPGRGGRAALGWDDAAARLVPRLTRPGFAAGLAADGHAALAVRPLFDGALELAFVLAYEGRSRYVRADEPPRWERTMDELLATAVANLAEASGKARFARVDTPDGPLVVARTGDGLDGARLLLPTLHDVLSPELGSPFLAAVPHRDALWACASEPSLARALAERVREDAARAPHAVSEALFQVDAAGVRPRG
jgi:hypothetical protein